LFFTTPAKQEFGKLARIIPKPAVANKSRPKGRGFTPSLSDKLNSWGLTIAPFDNLQRLSMSHLTDFDLRIFGIPAEWRQSLKDVLEVAGVVEAGIRNFGVENPAKDCPDLLLALTKMAIERHDSKGSSSGIGF